MRLSHHLKLIAAAMVALATVVGACGTTALAQPADAQPAAAEKSAQPASSGQQDDNRYAPEWYWWYPPTWPPAPRDSTDVTMLTYAVQYQPGSWWNPGKLVLLVSNWTPYTIKAQFPSGKTHAFEVKRYGYTIWQSTEGKVYTQAVTTDTFAPGETKAYTDTLPWLQPGWFQVNAYFAANGAPSQPVASTWVYISYGGDYRQPPSQYWPPYWPGFPGYSSSLALLSWDLSFRPKTWASSGYNRLVLQVRNTSDRDIWVYNPDGVLYKVVIQDTSGKTVWEYAARSGSAEVDRWYPFDVFRAGSTRYHFITVPDLGSGWFVARVYFPAAGDRPVAETWFSMK